MRPLRPALAPVLAALTCDGMLVDAELFALHLRADERLKPGLRLTARDVTAVHNIAGIQVRAMDPLPWTLRADEAIEALTLRELLPAHWADPSAAPAWWCERCRICGVEARSSIDQMAILVDAAHAVGPDCHCGGSGAVATPSLATLAAVASLGVGALARVEEVAAEAWKARVVWRSVARVDLREHHEDVGGQWMIRGDDSPPTVFSFKALWAMDRAGGQPSIMGHEPWSTDYAPITTDSAEEAWPALRALGLLGVHLLAHDPRDPRRHGGRGSRVVIGVEALP